MDLPVVTVLLERGVQVLEGFFGLAGGHVGLPQFEKESPIGAEIGFHLCQGRDRDIGTP